MASAQPMTDHEEIRRWAEERGARPACVRGTGGEGDPGMIRLDFPGFSGGDSLQEISWDEWFRQFDENNLALLVQDTTGRGRKSNFNKLVSRETAAAAGGRSRKGATSGSGAKRASAKRGSAKRASSKRGTAKRAARSGQGAGTRGARKAATSGARKSTARKAAKKTGAKRTTRAAKKTTRSRR